jgi:hypothetical protein
VTKLAVLIDAENIEVASATDVLAHARRFGDLNIVRLFGDFTEMRMSGWLDLARVKGYQPVLQLNGGRRKNSTDIALAIDAMDILHTSAVDAFCLVSDDRDFVPLAARLRAAGRRVYAICKSADPRMQSICTEVISLAAAASEPAIVKAFLAISTGVEEMTLSQVGSLLRKHAPHLVPAAGKGRLRKSLMETGRFLETGSGPGLRIRLKR